MAIDGKQIAAELIASLRPKIAELAPTRFFGAALVGNDPASINFLKQKEKTAHDLGVDFRLYRLPEGISTDELRSEIGRLVGTKTCGGFIVQLPLPQRINAHYALNAIPRGKDPDLLSEAALGAFYTGRSPVTPPSVAVVEEVLKRQGINDLREKTAAVIGAGFLIGKPIGFWLQNRVGELMVFDSKSKNLREKLREADIVISGAGVPGLFGPEHVKQNALVIDFGYGHDASGKIAGDFNPQLETRNAQTIAYTQTPGGTGPILVAELFQNFYLLNRLP